jgi:hypothetical protein
MCFQSRKYSLFRSVFLNVGRNREYVRILPKKAPFEHHPGTSLLAESIQKPKAKTNMTFETSRLASMDNLH